MKEGWAYRSDKNGIVIDTICETKQVAMVNALVRVAGMGVHHGMSEEDIIRMFESTAGLCGCMVEVVIREKGTA